VELVSRFENRGVNVRNIENNMIGISIDETHKLNDI